MATPFWTSNRAEVESILKLLCDNDKKHDWIWGPHEELKLRALAALMTRTLPGDRKIPWQYVREAINQCIAAGTTTLADLEKALQVGWDNGQRVLGAPTQPYRVVMPVDFGIAMKLTLPRDIKLADCDCRLVAFDSLEACLGNPTENQALHAYNTQGPSPSAYLEFKVDAPIPEIAASQAIEAATTWRAATNFLIASRSIMIQFCPSSRATIREPAWMAIQGPPPENTLATFRFVTAGEDTPRGGLSDQDLAEAETFLKHLAADSSPGSTSRLALDAIGMYGTALDQALWHHALFLLWQVAELLTLPLNERGNHDELCKRLVLLSDTREEQVRRCTVLALRDIKGLRNDIAHAGASGSIHDSDVQFLERMCREAIWWLIRNRDRFPTADHLRMYFRLAASTPADFDQIQQVHAQIKTLREKQGQ